MRYGRLLEERPDCAHVIPIGPGMDQGWIVGRNDCIACIAIHIACRGYARRRVWQSEFSFEMGMLLRQCSMQPGKVRLVFKEFHLPIVEVTNVKVNIIRPATCQHGTINGQCQNAPIGT